MQKRRSTLFALLLSLALALVGCGSVGNGPAPEKVAATVLTAMQQADWKTVADHSVDGKRLSPELEQERMMKAYMSKMSFKVGEATVKGLDAEVAVEITLPAIENLAAELVAEALKTGLAVSVGSGQKADIQQVLEEKLLASLADPAVPLVTSQSTVVLQQVGGQWKVKQIRGFTAGNLLP